MASGVHALGSRRVNWYVIEQGGKFTLVDTGLQTHWSQLLETLDGLGGRMSDVEAVLLTHAHGDHASNAERIRREAAATVYAHEADSREARSGKTAPPPVKAILKDIWRPEFILFLAELIRGGAMSFPPIVELSALVDGEIVDVPGRPRVVPVPGHTLGSCALHLSDEGVVFTGDALQTYTPVGSKRTGPMIIPDDWHDDPEQALASLDRLEGLGAHTVLPGHGQPWTGGIDEAVRQARAVGRR